ncbi:HTH merR-type domain-containing protein [Sphingomonas antarctica]|uniref:MerR family transcriptional regulator n=1 Tax=Sphingomonas antarctica TaxID=2040274 RepID=UPI0039EB5DEF
MLMIGDLAKRTGAKVNTIRFYEDIGLMPQAARTDSNRRTYREDDVRRLGFIRHARALGFAVGEIRSLIALSSDPDRSCADVGTIARTHLATVEDRIVRLMTLRDELCRVTEACDGGRVADCRIIEAISDGDVHAPE